MKAANTSIWLTLRQCDRFWLNVTRGAEDECWLWRGERTEDGYGRFKFNGRKWMAHRVSWSIFKDITVPAGLVLDHLCRTPACINPGHLEAVTNRENTVVRGVGGPAAQAARTHCIRGHELTAANVRVRRGRRECRTCINARLREARRTAE